MQPITHNASLWVMFLKAHFTFLISEPKLTVKYSEINLTSTQEVLVSMENEM